MDTQNLNIKQNAQFQMFFVRVPGGNAYLKYRKPSENLIQYYETYVPPLSRNRGIGNELVKFGINYAKSNDLEIRPSCRFVQAYLDKHPKHQDVLHNFE